MSETLTVSDLAEICRACLCKGHKDMFVSLNTEPARGNFIRSTHIYVESNSLPIRLCRVCLQKCADWLKFRTMVEKNERLFQSLRNPNPSGEPEKKATLPEVISESEFNPFADGVDDDSLSPLPDNGWDTDSIMNDAADEPQNDDAFDDPLDKVEITTAKNSNSTSQPRDTGPAVPCPVEDCLVMTVGIKGFEDHCITAHIKKSMMCPVCDLPYKSMDRLKDHLYLHTSHMFNCPECPKRMNNPRTYNSHLRDVHKIYPEKVDEPMEKQKVASDPLQERKTRSKNIPAIPAEIDYDADYFTRLQQNHVICPVCRISQRSLQALDKHIDSHLTKLSDCCPICDKQFERRHNFKYHLYTHTKITFTCTLCPKPRVFRNPSIYNDHMQDVHSSTLVGGSSKKSEGYSCTTCGKVFKHMSHLQAHEKTHKVDLSSEDEELDLICDLCGKVFKSEGKLNCHKQVGCVG